MEVRDPIHGFIELDEHEVRLINHASFQRLHHIHQLAMAYLVYPGATHTRFEHSLGVCHIAGMLADVVGLRPEQRQRVRLASLLHDIGHGPFSHVAELILVACNEGLPVGEVEEFHERIGLQVTRRLHRAGVIAHSLEGIENVLVPGALGATGPRHEQDRPPVRNVCRDIVSGPLDADKMDYLLRDSYYAGVQYGIYDLHRLAHAATTIEERPNSYLGVREEDVPAVDQFIIANHNMRIQVYGHRIRRVTDLMLVRSVVEAIREGNEDARLLFTYEESDAFLDRYMAVDDAELVRLVMSGPDGAGKELMSRLVTRRLPKDVLTVPLDEIADAELAERLHTKDAEAEAVHGLETRLAEHLGLRPPDRVLVEVRPDRPVLKTKGEAVVDTADIRVKLPDGRQGSYDQISRFFRKGGLADRDHVCVWVTIDEHDRERRDVERANLRRLALEVLPIGEEHGHGQA